MKTVRIIIPSILLLYCFSQAKNTYSSFSVGLAVPFSSAAPTEYAQLDPASEELTPVAHKDLKIGWDAGWTFFGLPFRESWNALSGLAFGGKINFSRWVRDSTWKELTFLGTQGIVRYYLPLNLKRFGFFGQVGYGMFIGEHGFADPDTLERTILPTPPVVTEGAKNTGVTFNIGMNFDVIEVTPGMTIVFTKDKSSAWFSLSAAAKF